MLKVPLRGVLAFATLCVFVLVASAQNAATVYGLTVRAQVDGLTRGWVRGGACSNMGAYVPIGTARAQLTSGRLCEPFASWIARPARITAA